MGINFGGFHISMAHKFLNHPDIRAGFKQMRRKTMTKRMASGFFILKYQGIKCLLLGRRGNMSLYRQVA